VSGNILLNRLIPKIFRPRPPSKLNDVLVSGASRNDVYAQMVDFYESHLPWELVRHRRYFSKEGRGFGEDAFHSMWFLLFSEFRPVQCLEIGVYRGQILTLWQLLAKRLGYQARIAGVSPFSSAGDSVSQYSETIDYLSDTERNHDHFRLDKPDFCVAYSNSDAAMQFISSTRWDLIYIDGSHDYNIVCQDWDISVRNIAKRGIVVMDDSSLYFDYKPGPGSFAGHPGPSKVAKEISQNQLKLIGGVGHNNIFMAS